MRLKSILLTILIAPTLLFSDSLNDLNLTKKIYSEQTWGVGATYRTSTIPYSSLDGTSGEFIPLLFFENDYIFLNGLESGFKLAESEDWRFSAIIRIHFVDIPKEYQDSIKTNVNDVGLQIQYKMEDKQFIDLEVMHDIHGRFFSNVRYSNHFENGSLEYKPYAQLQWNSSKYNSYYYGLDNESLSSGMDAIVGVDAKYHVISNLYLLAKLQSRILGTEARKSNYIDDNTYNEIYLGFGFFNDKSKKKKEDLNMSPYLRVAHGWGTLSNLNDIMTGNTEKDIYNNQFTSFFYGYPLADEFFSLPVEIYLTPGLVYHHSSDVQNSTKEYVLAVKAYYTFPLPWKVRFGIAEGISYINRVTYIEETDLNEKGYKPSKMLNFLDLSLDLNLGDIFGEKLDQWWLGYSIHHRSAAFESSSRFGNIKGGSNYNSAYIQWHF